MLAKNARIKFKDVSYFCKAASGIMQAQKQSSHQHNNECCLPPATLPLIYLPSPSRKIQYPREILYG